LIKPTSGWLRKLRGVVGQESESLSGTCSRSHSVSPLRAKACAGDRDPPRLDMKEHPLGGIVKEPSRFVQLRLRRIASEQHLGQAQVGSVLEMPTLLQNEAKTEMLNPFAQTALPQIGVGQCGVRVGDHHHFARVVRDDALQERPSGLDLPALARRCQRCPLDLEVLRAVERRSRAREPRLECISGPLIPDF
jgi:hypothetical protein